MCEEAENYIEESENSLIEFEKFSASWGDQETILKDINLQIQEKEFISVIGDVGAGKSSLLSALIGQMKLQQGSLKIRENAKIAYVQHTPWI